MCGARNKTMKWKEGRKEGKMEERKQDRGRRQVGKPFPTTIHWKDPHSLLQNFRTTGMKIF